MIQSLGNVTVDLIIDLLDRGTGQRVSLLAIKLQRHSRSVVSTTLYIPLSEELSQKMVRHSPEGVCLPQEVVLFFLGDL